MFSCLYAVFRRQLFCMWIPIPPYKQKRKYDQCGCVKPQLSFKVSVLVSAPHPRFLKMLILVYTAVFFYLEQSAGAEPNATCPTRCDVTTCPGPSCLNGYGPDRCSCCLGLPGVRPGRRGAVRLPGRPAVRGRAAV